MLSVSPDFKKKRERNFQHPETKQHASKCMGEKKAQRKYEPHNTWAETRSERVGGAEDEGIADWWRMGQADHQKQPGGTNADTSSGMEFVTMGGHRGKQRQAESSERKR